MYKYFTCYAVIAIFPSNQVKLTVTEMGTEMGTLFPNEYTTSSKCKCVYIVDTSNLGMPFIDDYFYMSITDLPLPSIIRWYIHGGQELCLLYND